MLPVDYDEDDYLLAAQHYAQALVERNWGEIVNYDYNYEHPPLPKLIYGLALSPLPESPAIPDLPTSAAPARSLPHPHFEFARTTAATMGALEVLALALLNPLAAFFLAIDTWQIKYTSQIMLEPLPALTSLLAVLFYLKSDRKWNVWLASSAVALGLTAAGKYLYCVAGIAILIDWLRATYPKDGIRARAIQWLSPMAVWGAVSLVAFFAADPYLWPDPAGRLTHSVLYHAGYAATSMEVQRANFPVWQPFVWLSGPVPWHPGVFLLTLDLFISLLALLGLRRLWRKQPVFVIWLTAALAFLLAWPVKWPQYILILTAPLCMAAAEGFAEKIWEPLTVWARSASRQKKARVESAISPRESRQSIPWLIPGLILLSLITLFPLIYQGAMALTDFNAVSIRDGINGGVWREVWLGATGQKEPAPIDVFSRPPRVSKEVHYTGPAMLARLFGGLFSDVLFFNVMWAVLSAALQAALGVSVALILNRRGVRFAGWWRALFVLPWAIPEFVGAVIWLRMFDPRFGWLTQALPGSVSAPSFSNNPNYALAVLLVAATWFGFPFMMLAATAGLKLVPLEAHESAALDGATAWQQFRFITWPLLWPLLAPALIIRAIFAFNQFYLFWVMRSSYPLITFSTLSYYLFSGNGGGQFGVSAAINVFDVAVLVVLILLFNRWSKAAEGVTYA